MHPSPPHYFGGVAHHTLPSFQNVFAFLVTAIRYVMIQILDPYVLRASFNLR